MTNRLMASMLALALLAGVAGAAAAQPPPVPKKPVQFAAGASSATITGTLVGDQTVDYTVRAAAGQTMAVTLKASNGQQYFNILPPGSSDAAFFIGSTSGSSYTGMLADDGTYSIRVYLMRAGARRNEKSAYTLTVSVTGTALPALPAAKDALVAGTRFHASGEIPCTPPYAQPTQCDAGVVRRGRDGTGTVEIKAKDGRVLRRLLFVAGKVVASDATDPVTLTRTDDLLTVAVGDERYAFPEALLTGG